MVAIEPYHNARTDWFGGVNDGNISIVFNYNGLTNDISLHISCVERTDTKVSQRRQRVA